MLYEKSIPQTDSVFRGHNEFMKEYHEETGALGSYLAKKKQQHKSKDMLDNLPTKHSLYVYSAFPRNRNYHYEAGIN